MIQFLKHQYRWNICVWSLDIITQGWLEFHKVCFASHILFHFLVVFAAWMIYQCFESWYHYTGLRLECIFGPVIVSLRPFWAADDLSFLSILYLWAFVWYEFCLLFQSMIVCSLNHDLLVSDIKSWLECIFGLVIVSLRPFWAADDLIWIANEPVMWEEGRRTSKGRWRERVKGEMWVWDKKVNKRGGG